MLKTQNNKGIKNDYMGYFKSARCITTTWSIFERFIKILQL